MLSVPGAALVAQPRQAPPQRGSPPNQDTPYILVTAFRAPDKKLAVEGADELRDRLKQEHSAKELFVITKNSVDGTLTASGYPTDSALNVSDLMELSKTMRGEYVMDVTAKSTGGKAVRLEPRILMKTGQQVVAQPLPAIDGKDVGDAVKQVEKGISEALKQIPSYKQCVASLRAGQWDAAATQARAGIAAYPGAAWSRICLLNAYSNAKTTPPDSIIAVAQAILEVDSTSMLALANIADAYKAKDDKAKMMETYLKMYALDKTNQGLVRSLIKELAQTDPAQALPLAEELLKELPGDPELLRDRLLIHLAMKNYKSAFASYDEAAKADTSLTSLDFYNRMIGAAQADSNNAKIVEFAEKAEKKFPTNADFPTLLAQTYRKMGKPQEAMAAARRATAIDPKNANGWVFAIVLANELNQSDSAMAMAKQAVAAGADKDALGQALVANLSPLVRAAQASNSRADWQTALTASQEVDAMAPSAQTKYFVGVASFQVAIDALNQVQEFAKKPATYTQGCEQLKVVEDNFATASINMPAGGSVDKETAGKILGVIGEYGKYIPQFKTSMKCK